jgi:hypothetical protein
MLQVQMLLSKRFLAARGKIKGIVHVTLKLVITTYYIWKPNVVSGGNGFRVNIKFDHILDNRKDDHLYTTIVNQGGRCSVQHQPVIGGQILGGIIPIRGTWRPTHEPGWEIALVNVANQVAFAYGCQ